MDLDVHGDYIFKSFKNCCNLHTADNVRMQTTVRTVGLTTYSSSREEVLHGGMLALVPKGLPAWSPPQIGGEVSTFPTSLLPSPPQYPPRRLARILSRQRCSPRTVQYSD